MLIFLLYFLLHAFTTHMTYTACPSVEPLALAITEKKSDSEIIKELEKFVKDGGDVELDYSNKNHPNILHLAISNQCSLAVAHRIWELVPENKRVEVLINKNKKGPLFTFVRNPVIVIAFYYTPRKNSDDIVKKADITRESCLEIFSDLKSEQIVVLLKETDLHDRSLLKIAVSAMKIKDFNLLFQKLSLEEKRNFIQGGDGLFLHNLAEHSFDGEDLEYIFKEYENEKELLKTLLEKRDSHGKSILHVAVQSVGLSKVAKLIINEYAKLVNNDRKVIEEFLTAQDNDGNTALILAVTPTWSHWNSSEGMWSDLVFYEKIKQIIFAYEKYISKDKREIYKFLSIKNTAGEDMLDRLKQTSTRGIFNKEIIFEFILNFFPDDKREKKEKYIKDFFAQPLKVYKPLSEKSLEAFVKLYDQLSSQQKEAVAVEKKEFIKKCREEWEIERSKKPFTPKKYVLGATVLFVVLGVVNELREVLKKKSQNEQKSLAVPENKEKGLLSFIKRKKLTLSLFACAGLCGVASAIISK